MTFKELLPVLRGNVSVDIYDSVGEIVSCGDCSDEKPEELCFSELSNISRVIGDKKVVSIVASTVYSGLTITIE